MSLERIVRTAAAGRDVRITDQGRADFGPQEWSAVAPFRGGEVTFVVTLSHRDRHSAPEGSELIGREWTADELDRAVAWEVESALVSPPEKQPGDKYVLQLSYHTLYRANGL